MYPKFFLPVLLIIVITGCDQKKAEHIPKTHKVKILQMKFQPEELWVEKSDTVEFINEDMVAHDVTEQPASKWTSGRLESGMTWKYIPEESAEYYCSLHKVMKGKIMIRQ